MRETIDGIISYAAAFVVLLFGFVLAYSSTIMTIGGLVLLALRIYVDGMKAWKTYKERHK